MLVNDEKYDLTNKILYNKNYLDIIDASKVKSGTIKTGRDKLSDLVNILPDGKYATIKLTHDKETIINTEFLWLAQDRWCFYPQSKDALNGMVGRKGRMSDDEPRTVLMHRLILNAPPHVIIDHINRNQLDNRLSNLRFAKTQSNAFNRKMPNVPSTSRYKGVFMRSRDKDLWTARIKLSNRIVELGKYINEEEAAMAYNEAATLLFGEYAKLNDVAEAPEYLKIKIYNKCRHRLTEAAQIIYNSVYAV